MWGFSCLCLLGEWMSCMEVEKKLPLGDKPLKISSAPGLSTSHDSGRKRPSLKIVLHSTPYHPFHDLSSIFLIVCHQRSLLKSPKKPRQPAWTKKHRDHWCASKTPNTEIWILCIGNLNKPTPPGGFLKRTAKTGLSSDLFAGLPAGLNWIQHMAWP